MSPRRVYKNFINFKNKCKKYERHSFECHFYDSSYFQYPNNSNTDSPVIRRSSGMNQLVERKTNQFALISSVAVQSPTNSLPLHIIREEHQQTSFQSSHSRPKSSSSSSSSEALYDIDDNEDEMDCQGNESYHINPSSTRQFIRPPYSSFRMPYHHHHHRTSAPYYCTISPLLAQRFAISTTNSSYTP